MRQIGILLLCCISLLSSGASVYDSRTQRGTATNNHGFFSLTLPVGVVRLETEGAFGIAG